LTDLLELLDKQKTKLAVAAAHFDNVHGLIDMQLIGVRSQHVSDSQATRPNSENDPTMEMVCELKKRDIMDGEALHMKTDRSSDVLQVRQDHAHIGTGDKSVGSDE
jgi:hypothetical protein